MQGVSDAADAVWINILMLLTSIPIITIGAALVAGNSAARRTIEGEGHATANYFAAFRSNFMRSTLLWLVFGPTLALLAYAWVVLQITPLLIPKFALSILWIIGFEWVWALQARFDNSFGRTLANAFILGISHIVLTATVIAIDAVFLALLVASWFYMPQGLFLLLVFGYGTLIMLHIPILDRCLNRYVASQGSEAN
jgi:uncharacterized membrane protein YesL